jgi:phenylalanine-4-hydroxylase
MRWTDRPLLLFKRGSSTMPRRPDTEAPRTLSPAAPADRRPDWTIDQAWEHYTPAEHATWKTLYERQCRLLEGRACDAFLQGLADLPIDAHEIPHFGRLSEALMARTGWQVVAVPGLVPGSVFFDHLANRRFPAGNFIRRPDQLDYLEEPDVFHDVFGHVPMLTNPVIADYLQAYGEGGLRARRLGQLAKLARVYWYTIEFGLIRQPDGLRLYGAGIASSCSETMFALDDPSPHRIGFDLERVMQSPYRIDDFQPAYFVIDDLAELLALAQVDFGPVYERLQGQPEHAPGVVLDSDRLIHRGTGCYHDAKRAAG